MAIARSAVSKLIHAGYFANRRRRELARNEAKRLSARVDAGATRAVVVYDAACSPPTYGDFLYVVALARYFVARGMAVDFLIVASEFRADWAALGEGGALPLADEKRALAERFLPGGVARRVRTLTWTELAGESATWGEECVVPFEAEVLRRHPLYVHAFNLLNHLLESAPRDQIEATLFSSRDLPRMESPAFPGGPYVAWHARHSLRWSPERNITSDEFRAIYGVLTRAFPGHRLVVVSDAAGCAYFRGIATTEGLEALFSKDISPDFTGDAALVLGSAFYFQLRGGGMSTIGLCSLIPYMIVAPMKNEVMWSRLAATSWQTGRQRFVNATGVGRRLAIPGSLLPAPGPVVGPA